MDEIPLDKIVRSRRRTIALIVTPEARVIVRAPLKAPAALIDAFVREHHGWIKKKVAEMKERPQVVIHAYEEGEVFWFLGRPYPLHIVDDGKAAIGRTDRLCVSRSLVPDIRMAV
ncbi:MAG: YgjP-like metallopeptidase domain-containing protein, partial [Methanoregula sp.]